MKMLSIAVKPRLIATCTTPGSPRSTVVFARDLKRNVVRGGPFFEGPVVFIVERVAACAEPKGDRDENKAKCWQGDHGV